MLSSDTRADGGTHLDRALYWMIFKGVAGFTLGWGAVLFTYAVVVRGG